MEIENVTVSSDFIVTVQQTEQVLVRTAAEIQNQIRMIEREHGPAEDEVVKSALNQLQRVSGDLAEQWERLDLSLAANDLTK